jgi:multisubunit Na+/H+ antiporter MnhE subunit
MSDLTAWIILGAFAVFVVVPAVGWILSAGRTNYLESILGGLIGICCGVATFSFLTWLVEAAKTVLV